MPVSKVPTAYSYIRFSSAEQAKGDSLRRQLELRDSWILRHGAILDTSLSLRDEGVSAFTGSHRLNPDQNALAAFLELVKRGRIARGSFLVVENLDRLTRENIRPALTLLLNLIEQGIRVVQLLPVEQVFDEHVEPMTLMMAIMELSRGHSESQMKSKRIGDAWREKKQRAASGELVTHVVPGWVRVVDGKLSLIPERAEVVRRIYRLATEGHGVGTIAKQLNADGVPTFNDRALVWGRPAVNHILTTRTVIGEYQPKRVDGTPTRKPDGPPVPNYFPAVITEKEWLAARAASAHRQRKTGRPGKHVNVFSGLLRDARDGGKLIGVFKSGKPMIVSFWASQGRPGSKFVSFPLQVFETAILSQLREIDPRTLLPDDRSAEEEMALKGKLADLDSRIEKLKGKLAESPDIDALVDVLRRLDSEKRDTAEALAAVQRKAAAPLAGAWDQCHSLADALAQAPDPVLARTLLRAAFRRVITGIWCLFVVKGRSRVAAVQVWFEGDRHRDYFIAYTPAQGTVKSSRPASWSVHSLALAAGEVGFDLRNRENVGALENVLVELDVKELGLG